MSTRLFAVLAVASIVATACTSSSPATTTTSSTTLPPLTTITTSTTLPPTTTTTLPPTTTTTIPPVEVFDTINGLEPAAEDPIGVLAVKVDNHPNARPHTGLQYADIVYELPVEAGLTRFIAMFEYAQLEKVGPVRSLRPTDPSIVNPPDVPLQVSGGSNWVLREVRASGTKLLTDNGNGTYRDTTRQAPHNLYLDTEVARAHVDELGWGIAEPGNLFAYGEASETTEEATFISIRFSAQPESVWRWDPETERYLHWYRDEPHITINVDGEEEQVAADRLIVIRADRFTARPPQPSDGKAVPAMDLMGTGEALVFHSGGVALGTWERTNVEDNIAVLGPDGEPYVVEPGVLWVSIQPTSETITYGTDDPFAEQESDDADDDS